VILLILPASSESTLRLDVAAPICARQAADVNPILGKLALRAGPVPSENSIRSVVRAFSENRGIILRDARYPVRARNIPLRSVQVAAAASGRESVLRHQLNIGLRALPRRRLRGSDRALLVWMARICPGLFDLAQVVKPQTASCWF
jgi:hypothetical protein